MTTAPPVIAHYSSTSDMASSTSDPGADTKSLDSEVEQTELIQNRLYQPWSLNRDASFLPVDDVLRLTQSVAVQACVLTVYFRSSGKDKKVFIISSSGFSMVDSSSPAPPRRILKGSWSVGSEQRTGLVMSQKHIQMQQLVISPRVIYLVLTSLL